MYRSPKYLPEEAAIEAFVAGQRHGTLLATPSGGHPEASILPFVKRGDVIEVHCVQADETFKAAQINPKVTFLVSDFLTWSRHDWVDPVDGGRATLHFRAVQYTCEATTSTAPNDVAAALRGLLQHYEPDAAYTPIEDGMFYGPRLRMLGVVRMRILSREAKFKVGSAAPAEIVRNQVAQLRRRNAPGDARAADVIEAYVSGQ